MLARNTITIKRDECNPSSHVISLRGVEHCDDIYVAEPPAIPKPPVTIKQAAKKTEEQKKTPPIKNSRVKKMRASFHFHLPKLPASHRGIAIFAFLSFALVTPLKAFTTYEHVSAARNSLTELKSEAKNAELLHQSFSQTQTIITSAVSAFRTANAELDHVSVVEEFILRNTPFFGKKYGVATRLIAAGEHVSNATQSYMRLFKSMQNTETLIDRLGILISGNRDVLSDLDAAADLVHPIDANNFTETERTFILTARDAILSLQNDAHYLSDVGPVLLNALGNEHPRRYLIVFQNPAELRPTGGFIGSYAIIDVEKGAVTSIETPAGGSYDLQGSLKKHVRAPLPLHIINPRWEFQDGNWFPDFPSSAKKLMWFLEKSQGPTVDGVIGINATMMPRLLEILGSVTVNGKIIGATKILYATAERDPSRVKNPKQFITDTTPALLENIKKSSPEHFLPLITTLLKGLENRDVQIFVTEHELQTRLSELGWDGAMRNNAEGDFLLVNFTNIGSQKTDEVTTQHIDHQAEIQPDGTVRVTVKIKRTQAASTQKFQDTQNISYVRVYTPLGSKLTSAIGFTSPPESLFQTPMENESADEQLRTIEKEVFVDPKSGTRVTEEFGHTAFGNWMTTRPGTATEASFVYTIPLSLFANHNETARYSFYWQRQSGSPPTTISSRVLLPDEWSISWVSDMKSRIGSNGILTERDFTTDILYGFAAQKKNR